MVALKIDPSKLPVPRLEPTRAVKPKPVNWYELARLEQSRERRVLHPVREEEPRPIKRKRKTGRTPTIWTEEEDKQLIELYLQGLGNAAIAAQMHMGKARISKRVFSLKRNGTIPKCASRDPRIWKEAEIEQFISLYNEGKSYEDIAEAIGKGVSACKNRGSELARKGIVEPRRKQIRH